MEGKVFPKVADLLSRFVQIRLNTDDNPDLEKHLDYQRKLTGSVGRPMYVVVDPDRPFEALGPPHQPVSFQQAKEAKRLARWLRRYID